MLNLQKKEIIIWDWNGTLLNDVDHCIQSMNRLLIKRGLPLLEKERYLEIFTFPIREYYLQVGFDFSKEPFEIPAEEFIDNYQIGFESVKLYPDVISTLDFFRRMDKKQFILSAMEHDALIKSVREREIISYFSNINGIGNNLAHGKNELAKEIIRTNRIDPEKAVLIGDTLHDADVARETGIENILISTGHQSKTRLEKTGNRVFDTLHELTESYSV